MIFASGGYRVSLYDIDQSQVSRSLTAVKERLERYKQQGCLRGQTSAAEQLVLISGHTNLTECLKDAIYVQVIVFSSATLFKPFFKNSLAAPDLKLGEN